MNRNELSRNELARRSTIHNFEYIFGASENAAWGAVIAGNKKERIEFYNERYQKIHDAMTTEIFNMIEEFFDLQGIIESLPEEVSKEIYEKWAEMRYERKYGKTEE